MFDIHDKLLEQAPRAQTYPSSLAAGRPSAAAAAACSPRLRNLSEQAGIISSYSPAINNVTVEDREANYSLRCPTMRNGTSARSRGLLVGNHQQRIRHLVKVN